MVHISTMRFKKECKYVSRVAFIAGLTILALLLTVQYQCVSNIPII